MSGRRNHGKEPKQEAMACFMRSKPARGWDEPAGGLKSQSPALDCIHPFLWPFFYPSLKLQLCARRYAEYWASLLEQANNMVLVVWRDTALP